MCSSDLEARAARHERESRRRRTLSGPGGPTYKPDDWYAAELPMRFRDDAYRAAALERYAPPRSASLREEFHADLAAYFLDVAAGSGSRALRADTRRALRAGLWHAAAGRDVNSVADVLGRRGVMACLSRPGARSDVRAVCCGEVPLELWGAWRDRMATWMSADDDDAPPRGLARDSGVAAVLNVAPPLGANREPAPGGLNTGDGATAMGEGSGPGDGAGAMTLDGGLNTGDEIGRAHV